MGYLFLFLLYRGPTTNFTGSIFLFFTWKNRKAPLVFKRGTNNFHIKFYVQIRVHFISKKRRNSCYGPCLIVRWIIFSAWKRVLGYTTGFILSFFGICIICSWIIWCFRFFNYWFWILRSVMRVVRANTRGAVGVFRMHLLNFLLYIRWREITSRIHYKKRKKKLYTTYLFFLGCR